MGAPRAVIAAAAIAALWGCGFQGQRVELKDVMAPTEPAPLLSDGTTKVPYQEHFEYEVGNGDALMVEVAGHREFSGRAVIDQRGRMGIPNTTDILEVNGLTLRELEGRIALTVSPYVAGKPDVHINLTEARSKMYYVLGGVGAPGIYRMGGEIIRLREAIARAGLFREYRADETRVGIITPDPVKPTYVIANGKKIMMGDDSQNVIIKSGDVIFVQDKVIYDIDGFLYTLFRETENASTANKAVEFWEDAVKGDIGDFSYPRSSVTVVY